MLASALIGAALAVNLKVGLAMLAAACYVPLAMSDLGAGIVLWVPLTFLTGVSALNYAGKGSGLVLALGWLGVLVGRRQQMREVILRHRHLFVTLIALLVWLTLSTAWASKPSQTVSDLWHWYAVGLLLLILMTSLPTRRVLQLAVAAFVLGSLISVVFGLAGGVAGSEAGPNSASYFGRLGGATGDPNYLAAGVVPAVVLAAVLIPSASGLPGALRLFLWVAIPASIMLLIGGLISSQSRGGLVGGLIAVVVSVVVFRKQRAWVVAVLSLLVGVSIVWFASSPGAWQRVTTLGKGSGRFDEWNVALRISGGHPVTGVGDANYVVVARNYVRRPGSLSYVQYLVDQPHVVHNTYLQFLAETGVVGLGLFLALIGGCLRAAWIAARKFARAGDHVMEILSRGVFVALVGMLTCSAFISIGVDQRLWVLFALAPALLLAADAQARHPESVALARA